MRPTLHAIPLALALVAVGCSPNGEGETPTPDETAAPTASATPTLPPNGAGGPCVEGCTAIHTWEAGDRAGLFGWAVADLTDIDGDGANDVITGAPFNGANGSSGVMVVYSGATGALLYHWSGEDADYLGWALADAGDVDGDGTHDIVGGAPDATLATPGEVFVFSGADGSLLLTASGEANGDFFGYAVASAGDVNSDGHADILVGASAYDGMGPGSDSGRVYVISGKDGGILRTADGDVAGAYFGSGTAHVTDLNGDGISETIVGAPGGAGIGTATVLSGSDGAPLFTFTADGGAFAYGDFFVADAGDVDADGTHDLYVGDYAHSLGKGRVYIYSGKDGSRLHTFVGATGEGLGCGRGAGDVDGDGHADLITGGYTSSEGVDNGGKVYIRSGADGTTLRTLTHNVQGAQLGFDAVGLGDVNGDSLIDFLIAAPPGETVYVIAGE